MVIRVVEVLKLRRRPVLVLNLIIDWLEWFLEQEYGSEACTA
jgi:hypothetical protein